jgi:hypothetical protein
MSRSQHRCQRMDARSRGERRASGGIHLAPACARAWRLGSRLPAGLTSKRRTRCIVRLGLVVPRTEEPGLRSLALLRFAGVCRLEHLRRRQPGPARGVGLTQKAFPLTWGHQESPPKRARMPCSCGWAVQGSNLRPPACKAGALPAELTARAVQRNDAAADMAGSALRPGKDSSATSRADADGKWRKGAHGGNRPFPP